MSLAQLMNPAGGLRYHLRALRYKEREWQPFRWNIGEWLLGWQPPERTLILVGPSAGYCLQPFFFERFDRVICLEPDPLAKWLLARHIGRAPLDHRPAVEFVDRDCLVEHPERLPELVDNTPDAALLFTNVLGQMRALLRLEEPQAHRLEPIRKAIAQSIAGRSWASFHDRVSGYLKPAQDDPVTSQTRMTDQEIIEELYEVPNRSMRMRQHELVDHLTEGLLPPDWPHTYFTWQIEPGRFHLIEAVAHSIDAA